MLSLLGKRRGLKGVQQSPALVITIAFVNQISFAGKKQLLGIWDLKGAVIARRLRLEDRVEVGKASWKSTKMREAKEQRAAQK